MAGLRQARARRQTTLRWVVLVVLGIFFLLPLYAMAEFTSQDLNGGGWTAVTWNAIVHARTKYPDLWSALSNSLGQAVLTVVLMLIFLVPTMTWIRLRLPRLRRPMEFVCLLPLTVPAIVLVVGLAPVYAWVVYFVGESSIWLCFAYTILVLPYAYRAIDSGLAAIDVSTLSEAARSLGASWPTVLVRIVLPNIRAAVLSASFISIAVVFGEFTIASLLNYSNIQVAINNLSKRDAQAAIGVSLVVLLLAFVLLVGLSFVGGRRRRTTVEEPEMTPAIAPVAAV